MGADLIGIMLVGPKTLNEDSEYEAAVVDTAHRHITGVREAAVGLLQGVPQGVIETRHPQYPDLVMKLDLTECRPETATPLIPADEWSQTSEDAKWDWINDIVEGVVDPDMVHVIHHDSADVQKAMSDFRTVWRGETRDSASRLLPDNPDKQVVFAGERTWGDEPEGYGYTSLRDARALGIAQAYGVE
jgi:hypothetical protein